MTPPAKRPTDLRCSADVIWPVSPLNISPLEPERLTEPQACIQLEHICNPSSRPGLFGRGRERAQLVWMLDRRYMLPRSTVGPGTSPSLATTKNFAERMNRVRTQDVQIDCVAEHISHQDLDGVIRRHMPDIVGITSFTTSLVDVQMAAQAARRVVPDAHICMGGHHPISFPY